MSGRVFNWRCWFGLHSWGRWGAPRTVEAIVTYNPEFTFASSVDVTIVRQDRVCDGCGQAQTREVVP